TYIAAYRSTTGNYSVTPGLFSSPVTRGPLTADTNAGAFSYPPEHHRYTSSSSYLVDVVFNKAPAQIAVVSQTPANGAIDAPTSSTISMALSVPVATGYTVSVTSGGSAIAGSSARAHLLDHLDGAVGAGGDRVHRFRHQRRLCDRRIVSS
ncbi:hypothetical protein AB4Z22_44240, partial [Paenibacillus sp. TAF58]